jgi:DNA polymerase-3 subunit beta
MKLSCLQENLSRGLSIVGRAVATRTTLPITNNVLIATDQSRLKLVATNLEMAISYWLGAQIEDEGMITVPARLLSEFVNSLPNEKIDISLSNQTKTLELKCARFEARISGVDAKDFPPIRLSTAALPPPSRPRGFARQSVTLPSPPPPRNRARCLPAWTPFSKTTR